MDDLLIESALRSLDKKFYSDEPVIADLRRLVEELDAQCFDAYELYERGRRTKDAYLALL